jgi:glutathione synthase/RimK-type ligase-like ATP-grasp enzyme
MSTAKRVIGLATSEQVAYLTSDDRLLVEALAANGVDAEPAIWNDDAVNWEKYSAVVIRSTWDYHLYLDEFLAWLDRLESLEVKVFNAPSLVRWNTEKGYLRDLSDRGIAIVPTRWVERGEKTSLAEILRETGWHDVVVKPAVSASAHRTWRMSADNVDEREEEFASMVDGGRVLVQPFLTAIQSEGEWSLLFYGDVYSHSVLKRPRHDDFRVQQAHGGTSSVLESSTDVVEQAHRVLEAAGQASLYTRVDGCVVDGRFVLMELELIEPDLFLRAHPSAPTRLAEALLNSDTSLRQ